MIYLTAATPILIATAPADFRRGVDGFVALCQHTLGQNPRSGTLYVFRNRARTMIRILVYEQTEPETGRGYWLMTKRLSSGRFKHWPNAERALCPLAAQHLRQLLNAMVESKHG